MMLSKRITLSTLCLMSVVSLAWGIDRDPTNIRPEMHQTVTIINSKTNACENNFKINITGRDRQNVPLTSEKALTIAGTPPYELTITNNNLAVISNYHLERGKKVIFKCELVAKACSCKEQP